MRGWAGSGQGQGPGHRQVRSSAVRSGQPCCQVRSAGCRQPGSRPSSFAGQLPSIHHQPTVRRHSPVHRLNHHRPSDRARPSGPSGPSSITGHPPSVHPPCQGCRVVRLLAAVNNKLTSNRSAYQTTSRRRQLSADQQLFAGCYSWCYRQSTSYYLLSSCC